MWRIEFLETVDSTQDLVMQRAEEGEPEGLVIHAGHQEKGRGRHGRIWASLPGNLQMSVLLRPQKPINQAVQLSYVVAVSIAAAVDKDFQLKWPNDIYVGGRKCGGVLIEACGGDALAIGIGMNVRSAPDGHACLGEGYEVDAVRDAVLGALAEHYGLWLAEGFEPIRVKWLKNALNLKQMIQFKVHEAVHSGVFAGVGPDGALLLRGDDGTITTFQAGEVLL